jgi:cell division protein FtsA
MDTRVGYPNEHLAGETDKNVTSPLYATAVGLVMDGLKKIKDQNESEKEHNENDKLFDVDSNVKEDEDKNINDKPKESKKRESFLDKLTEKLKDFLENAE